MKLHNTNIVDAYKEEMDSVKFRESQLGEDRVDKELIVRCENLWNNLDYLRRARAKVFRFAFGDHWEGRVLIKGKWIPQREYLSMIGVPPLQTNLVKRVFNSISGLWTKEKNAPVVHALNNEWKGYGEGMTEVMRQNCKLNRITVLGGEWLTEANAGGLVIAREEYSKREGKYDARTKVVNPNMFFFESGMQDSSFADLTLVGQLHDLAFNDLCAFFAKSPDDFATLREWYSHESYTGLQPDPVDLSDANRYQDISFNRPRQHGFCRVIEVWTRERRPRYHVLDTNSPEEPYDINADDRELIKQIKLTNRDRLAEGRRLGWTDDQIPLIEYKDYWYMDTYWYCRYLTPEGHVLWEGESTLPDRGHPYTIMAVPFANGRIVGHASDAVDNNMAIDRMLIMDDMVKRAGAKGLMMVPEDIVPDWMSWDEFADQATSINGVIYYKPRPHGQKPDMIFSHSTQVDTANMVKLMSDLMESSVSVTGAIQGKTPYAGTSAALYAQQTQNSATPLAPLLERFGAFLNDVMTKKLAVIQQNYTIQDYADIVSSSDILQAMNLNLSMMGDIRYKVTVEQGVDTPTYRMIANDDLKEFLAAGFITFDDFLATSTQPYAIELQRRLQARQQQLMEQQAAMAAAGLPPAQEEEPADQ